MDAIDTTKCDCWVIGYGNFLRRDDGIGHYIIGRVEKAVKHIKTIHTLALHQMDPALVEELQHARVIIFVDATMDLLENGWKWVKITTEYRGPYHVTHRFDPSFFLGLIYQLYEKYPETWLVTVQGDNFEFREGLTVQAEQRACRAASEIIDFLGRHYDPQITDNHLT